MTTKSHRGTAPTLARDLKWGVGYGLAFAAAYSAIVLVQYLVTGPGVVESRHITLGPTIAAYFVGGVVGGALVGLLRPFTRWRVGATLIGIIACLPLAIAFVVVIDGSPSHWKEETIVGTLIAAVLIGAIVGYRAWEAPS